jgi:hypothetical protein
MSVYVVAFASAPGYAVTGYLYPQYYSKKSDKSRMVQESRDEKESDGADSII